MAASSPFSSSKRLDSWKEIASFFGRDERTVSRWEKDLGLPVHRLPGAKGRVYAFADELSAWLAAPNHSAAGADRSGSQPELVETDPMQSGSESPQFTLIHGGGRSADRALLDLSPGQEIRPPASGYRQAIRLATATLLVMAAVALVILRPTQSRTSKSAGTGTSRSRETSLGNVALASSPSHDPQAEQLYLKGRYYWNKRTPDDLNKALDYFMQSAVHDPNYAQAYVGLADCYNLMREYTLMPAREAYPRALVAAKKAVELDDQSSEAHASLAFVSFFGMLDIANGEREFRRALDLNPNSAASHHWYANALLALHRYPEALAEIDHAQALDPTSAPILADKGNALMITGRRGEALILLKQMEAREPAFHSPHLYLKWLYLRDKDYPNFLAEMRKDALIMRDSSALAIATAGEKGFAAAGPQGMFKAMLPVQEKLCAQQLLSPVEVAQTLALSGNKTEALRYLNLAYEQHDGGIVFTQAFPEFDGLHNEPAYLDLLVRLNLPVPSA